MSDTLSPAKPHTITTIEDLESLYGAANPRSLIKEIDYISDHYRTFIEKSPFVVLASIGPEGLDCSPRGDPAAAETRLFELLEAIVADGVSSEELDKARNLRVAAFWRQLQTINGKASALGGYEIFTGDHENLFAIPEQLAAVTPADLQAVAAKTLRRRNATIGILRAPLAGSEE